MFSRSGWSVMALRCLIILLMLSAAFKSAAAQSCLAIIPANYTINFNKVAVGTTTLTQDIEVTNLCAPVVQVSTYTMGPSEFILMGGWAPISLGQGQNMIFEVRFAPD